MTAEWLPQTDAIAAWACYFRFFCSEKSIRSFADGGGFTGAVHVKSGHQPNGVAIHPIQRCTLCTRANSTVSSADHAKTSRAVWHTWPRKRHAPAR